MSEQKKIYAPNDWRIRHSRVRHLFSFINSLSLDDIISAKHRYWVKEQQRQTKKPIFRVFSHWWTRLSLSAQLRELNSKLNKRKKKSIDSIESGSLIYLIQNLEFALNEVALCLCRVWLSIAHVFTFSIRQFWIVIVTSFKIDIIFYYIRVRVQCSYNGQSPIFISNQNW